MKYKYFKHILYNCIFIKLYSFIVTHVLFFNDMFFYMLLPLDCELSKGIQASFVFVCLELTTLSDGA